jgi:hypothetical protein
VLALVVGGGVTVLTGRVAVAGPVRVDTTSYLNETAVSGYAYVTRGYELLPLGVTIDVAFFNGDTTGQVHTFTILNWTNRTVPTSDSTADLGALINKYHALVNVTEGTEGQTAYGSFKSPPAPGYYEFVCMTSGHFGLGMYGYIAFGEALPSNLSFGGGSPGPGLAVFIIVGTIVTLTVLAIVLGFVIGRRHGAVHEMPPERLGYPEPSAPEPLPPAPPRGPPAP